MERRPKERGVTIEFDFISESGISPDALVEIMNIKPKRIKYKGDPISRNSQKPSSSSYCGFSFYYSSENQNVDDICIKLINVFSPFEKNLANFIVDSDFILRIYFYVDIFGLYFPAIIFPKSFIDFISKLEARLSVEPDLYIEAADLDDID